VVPVPELAGVGRHVVDVMRRGVPGWRVVVLCPDGPLASALRDLGVAVLTARVDPGSGFRTASRGIRGVVERLRPALVHSHLAFADVTAAAATVGLPVALVSTEHGIAADDRVYHSTKWLSRTKSLMHATRLRRLDALIAVSQSTAHVVRQKWAPPRGLRIRVIPNGVDPLPVPPRPEPGLHIISLARFAPEKGLEHLVRSFALLVAAEHSARMTMAGAGPLLPEIEALVRERGLEEHVEFPGFVPAADLLARGHVLAQLSRWENCSYSLLDAQIHGLGVVATAVGGNPEQLPPGCLVRAADHPAVADRLRTQGLDLAARPRLASEWPTLEAMCAAISEVYKEVTR